MQHIHFKTLGEKSDSGNTLARIFQDRDTLYDRYAACKHQLETDDVTPEKQKIAMDIPRDKDAAHEYGRQSAVQTFAASLGANVLAANGRVVDGFDRIVGEAVGVINIATDSRVLAAEFLSPCAGFRQAVENCN